MTYQRQIVAVIALFFIALRYVFIGDASFVNDEARLLSSALESNVDNTWATVGLLGSRGVTYSPVAVWVYQTLLMFSLNPITILLAKTTLDTVILAIALFGLSRLSISKGFPSLLWIVPLSSPYFWFYARSLWDNTFIIALVSMSLLLYLAFLEKGGIARFVSAVFFSALAVSFHLMAIPWAVALVIHGVFLSPTSLRERLFARLPATLLYAPLAWYYLHQSFPANATLNVTLNGLEGVFFGLRSMTGLGIEYLTGPWLDLRSGFLMLAVRLIGVVLGIPLILVSLKALWELPWRDWPKELRAAPGVIYLTVALHSGLALVAGLHIHPQYFNAIWVFYLFILGFFLARQQPRLGLSAVKLGLVGNALVIGSILLLAHQHHGLRSIRYGSSIAEKWRIAREINERSSIASVTLPDDVAPFPHAFAALSALDKIDRSLQPATDAPAFALAWQQPASALNSELMLQPKENGQKPPVEVPPE